MHKEANIAGIRKWMSELPETGEDTVSVDQAIWPDAILKLSPKYARIIRVEDHAQALRAEWGGVFGHWGLVVGPEKMETPPSDKRPIGEYRLKLTAGAYVFHEMQ